MNAKTHDFLGRLWSASEWLDRVMEEHYQESSRFGRVATASKGKRHNQPPFIEPCGLSDPASFVAALEDGVLLCQLMAWLEPGSIEHINLPNPEQREKMGPDGNPRFFVEENLRSFLSACAALGIPSDRLFQPDDLLGRHNLEAVVNTIHAVGKICTKRGLQPMIRPWPLTRPWTAGEAAAAAGALAAGGSVDEHLASGERSPLLGARTEDESAKEESVCACVLI